MDNKTYEQFFEALEKIVEENKSASEKIAELKAYMGEREEMYIEELITWFEKE